MQTSIGVAQAHKISKKGKSKDNNSPLTNNANVVKRMTIT